MVQPQPSKAVVGDVVSSSVVMYDLVSQVPSSATQSVLRAEADAILPGTISSIVYSDGATILRFHAPYSWFSTFVGSDPTIWLLWAHGSEVLPLSFPSYHTGSRGALPVSRDQLLGSSMSPGVASSPPPALVADPITNYCEESITYRVAKCYMSTSSLEPAVFDNQSNTYDHQMELTNEFRVAWTISGDYPSGFISIMMQARTTSWVGFGVRPEISNATVSRSGNGMVDVDIYTGMVA